MSTFLKIVPVLMLSIFTCKSQTTDNNRIAEQAQDISPLLIGESIPEATLLDKEGNLLILNNLITSKPTVLAFYRGGWCPYCNKHLSALADIEEEIIKMGYQIIAVSPDDYRNLKPTESNTHLNYRLLSDPEGVFIQEVGIAFKTPEKLKSFIASKAQTGDTTELLPVPTTMVLDQSGKIQFEYINPDYKERLSGEMLLGVLKTLKK